MIRRHNMPYYVITKKGSMKSENNVDVPGTLLVVYIP